jgi:hypothetical protein
MNENKQEAIALDLTVKTHDGRAVEWRASRDVTVAEALACACRELGIRDAHAYALLARGELLAAGERTLVDAVGLRDEASLALRLVAKPLAG